MSEQTRKEAVEWAKDLIDNRDSDGPFISVARELLELVEENKLAKERLGPSGYKLLEELKQVREENKWRRGASDLLGDLARRTIPGECDSGDALVQMIGELRKENRALVDELSACKALPGGCSYWREAAKLRFQELDHARAEIERYRRALFDIQNGPAIPLYHSTHTPKEIAIYTAQWSQDIARQALNEAKETK
jgi:hypothetical protein